MLSFRLEKKNPLAVALAIEGEITEGSKFEKLDLDGVKELHLDTAKVKYINSSGISLWTVWVRDIKARYPFVRITVRDVPYVLVYQISTLSNFLPDGARVLSLWAPYCCDSCHKTERRLLVAGADYKPDSTPATLENMLESGVECVSCGVPMGLDALPSIYLKVLQKYG